MAEASYECGLFALIDREILGYIASFLNFDDRFRLRQVCRVLRACITCDIDFAQEHNMMMMLRARDLAACGVARNSIYISNFVNRHASDAGDAGLREACIRGNLRMCARYLEQYKVPVYGKYAILVGKSGNREAINYFNATYKLYYPKIWRGICASGDIELVDEFVAQGNVLWSDSLRCARKSQNYQFVNEIFFRVINGKEYNVANLRDIVECLIWPCDKITFTFACQLMYFAYTNYMLYVIQSIPAVSRDLIAREDHTLAEFDKFIEKHMDELIEFWVHNRRLSLTEWGFHPQLLVIMHMKSAEHALTWLCADYRALSDNLENATYETDTRIRGAQVACAFIARTSDRAAKCSCCGLIAEELHDEIRDLRTTLHGARVQDYIVYRNYDSDSDDDEYYKDAADY